MGECLDAWVHRVAGDGGAAEVRVQRVRRSGVPIRFRRVSGIEIGWSIARGV